MQVYGMLGKWEVGRMGNRGTVKQGQISGDSVGQWGVTGLLGGGQLGQLGSRVDCSRRIKNGILAFSMSNNQKHV